MPSSCRPPKPWTTKRSRHRTCQWPPPPPGKTPLHETRGRSKGKLKNALMWITTHYTQNTYYTHIHIIQIIHIIHIIYNNMDTYIYISYKCLCLSHPQILAPIMSRAPAQRAARPTSHPRLHWDPSTPPATPGRMSWANHPTRGIHIWLNANLYIQISQISK